MVSELLQRPVTQEEFGALVGISQQKVSQLLAEGILQRGDTAHGWLVSYLARLREQAAGRQSSDIGALDLVQERAALARSQRVAQDMKNAIARGEYAPIGLLADVLGAASAGVVDRIDQLEGALRKACPDLPEAARLTVLQVLASARNEWIRATSQLVADTLAEPDDPAAELAADPAANDDEGLPDA